LEVTGAIEGGVVSGTQQRARQGNWSMETVVVVVAEAVKGTERRMRQECHEYGMGDSRGL
jgi:hypothetical protein